MEKTVSDSLNSFSDEKELSCENVLARPESTTSRRVVRRVNSKNSLVSRKLQKSKSWIKDSFLHRIHIIDDWIPKHVVTVDEKHLHRCLDLINASASSRTASCSISIGSSWGSMDVLSDGLSSVKVGSDYRFDLNCALDTGGGSLVATPAGDWIVGSIMGSKSMVNLLQSPLLRQYGAFNTNDVNFRDGSFADVKGSSSPGGLSSYSSSRTDIESTFPLNYRNVSENSHERLFSISSTNSTCSDQSSLSSSGAVTQGMLQFTLKNGNPHFVFSIDDQKVVYVASLWRAKSRGDDKKSLDDYTYLFHSRTSGQEEDRDTTHHGLDSHLVGKMVVSTSFSISENNSRRTMVREFVLFGGNESFMEVQASNLELRKNRRLSRKVSEVFRKKRSLSKFGGSSGTILENSVWGPLQETADYSIDSLGGSDLIHTHLPSNFELTAIVVKEGVPEICQAKVGGGWGLKFLQKASDKKQHSDDTEPSSTASASCTRDAGDCSTSMDIILPAGLHGGPRTRYGGPSSLVDRWRSGGCCDCGGWDLGCPLTVLKGKSSNKDLLLPADGQRECRLIDLFIQGPENSAPPLRMINVHDGLYFVHFQSTLSALQSFSIAVAFIHSQSPVLRPKSVHGA
ncbi:unnamed protein product [Linum tenue]|uniref:Peptidase A1 domain-containing protein n=1 Tax=Linum tenue TaxID=586396 RepID=A0AAV0HE64_9ROSI|nr:unnamed protein product [Linum tenue]